MSMEQQMMMVQDNEQFLNSFPPGYRFKPTDVELVKFYLKNKIFNHPLPPSKIKEVNIYECSPMELSDRYDNDGSGTMYFFTPRKLKCINGVNVDRIAGKGFWKASAKAGVVEKFDGFIAYKRSLVYQHNFGKEATKTDWLMKEFTLTHHPTTGRSSDQRLENWALCNVYNKNMRSSGGGEDNGHVAFPESSPGFNESCQYPLTQRLTLRGSSQLPLMQRVIGGESFQHPSMQKPPNWGQSSQYPVMQRVASGENSQHPPTQMITRRESSEQPIMQKVISEENFQHPFIQGGVHPKREHSQHEHPIMTNKVTCDVAAAMQVTSFEMMIHNTEQNNNFAVPPEVTQWEDTFWSGVLPMDQEDSEPIDFGGAPNFDQLK